MNPYSKSYSSKPHLFKKGGDWVCVGRYVVAKAPTLGYAWMWWSWKELLYRNWL